MRILLILFLSFAPHLVQAQTAAEAQEFIQMYVTGPTKTGDMTSSEEMKLVGSIYQVLEELPKQDYIQALQFLQKNWNLNSQNSQRLFILLQKRWQNNQGLKLATIHHTSKNVATEVGLLTGVAGTSLYTAKLLLPLLAAKRNPMSIFKFNWSSGIPVATTFGGSLFLGSEMRTKEADQYLKGVRPSPASILGFPMTEPLNKELTLSDHEISEFYSTALALGMTGLAHDLLKVRQVATGAKVTGSTVGRVATVFALSAAVGFAAEAAIDVELAKIKFGKLQGQLQESVNELNQLRPTATNGQIVAQDIYNKTNNIMQVQLLKYYQTTNENADTIRMLQQKMASSVFANLPRGAWEKDTAEADLYLAMKDVRDAFLSSLSNEECQFQVDLYLMLNSLSDPDAPAMSEHFEFLNPRSQQVITVLQAFIEKQKQKNPALFQTLAQQQAYIRNVAAMRLDKLTASMIKNFSQGQVCGGALHGHPLHLLLSASLYLKNFSASQTWMQTNALEQSFMDIFDTRMNVLRTKLVSPNERKVNEGELIDISEYWKRKGFKKKN